MIKILRLLILGLVVFLIAFQQSERFGNADFFLMPHHGLVADLMDEFYEININEDWPDVVVVIGPNHYNFGIGCIQSSYEWVVDQQKIELYDNKFIEELESKGVVNNGNRFFNDEHSLNEHVKSLSRIGFEGPYLPIMIAECANEKLIENTINTLRNELKDKNVVYIASIDFTHMDSIENTKLNDIRTIRQIQEWFEGNEFDLEAWRNIKNSISGEIEAVAIDSPETMYAWLKIIEFSNRRKGFSFDVWKNTNSLELLDIQDPRLMTSHIFGKVADVVE